MSQQDFDKYAPRAKSDGETLIPFAGIHAQTRGGKDELIAGAAPMVWDSGNSVYVPADQSNPLHVKAKAIEDLVGALDATKEQDPDAASATLLSLIRGLLSVSAKETTLNSILGKLADPATETTLDDVKTAVSALSALIDSGALQVKFPAAQNVTLSGQLVKLIKEHKEVPYDVVSWVNNAHQVGENISRSGSGVIPLDTSEYPHVDILVHNNTDVPLQVGVRIYPAPVTETSSYGPGVFRNPVLDAGVLQPGNDLWIRSVEEPQLNRVAAMYVSLFTIGGSQGVPTGGTYTVLFLGSRI